MNYTKTEEDLIYDFILENELVSQEALDLGLACGGNTVETLNYIIYRYTGYHDIEQLWIYERDNFFINDELVEYYGLGEEETEEDDEEE
jgi:hypothetical protein